ncbi:MAG: 30S ribosomal protein S17P [Candidatus Diapherotrites archaeon ADurb.Bin253]|jgi:small subunit ribosomal protein S17|nr:30S ribosomal protein S17 [Candidatus Pacearchaeota archaeon]OQA68113.1 MAG: 30S ribosomal protein S17P [Candidatus Diapherotrites archaeon ADurb.Bin253]HOC96824.1 30S ribosomal protein S17 [Candidatus Pacearchaeota archaeon]HOF44205.1 30S ribosomal protein S17 [Candidatus Pacearchaeota archaeon]HOR52234.1 30S ribosomal protein S17 [Candidatus Pacearchaeota archaeon]
MERKQKTKARSKDTSKKNQEEKKIASAENDKKITTRGRIFEGIVTKKFPKRIVLEFERMVYIRKYERYAKMKIKMHARLPDYIEKEINIGDLVRIRECRPLSKIIHFVVIEKIKDASEANK